MQKNTTTDAATDASEMLAAIRPRQQGQMMCVQNSRWSAEKIASINCKDKTLDRMALQRRDQKNNTFCAL